MPIVKKLSDFLGEQVKQMRTNRGLLTSAALGIAVFSITGMAIAQTPPTVSAASLTTQSGSSGFDFFVYGRTTNPVALPVFGPPISLQTSTFTSAIGADFISGLPSTTKTVNSDLNLVLTTSAGSASFSWTGLVFTGTSDATGANFNFGHLSASPLTYGLAGTNLFSARVSSNFVLGTATTGAPADPGLAALNLPVQITYLGVIPEPATLALFSLGLAPVMVAIRRRRK
ncbi:PEP-CTERM sorting domain-containing protein [Armatimonas sp.]|uniref:PEP-CTERM sorting domain-containing protein n=1 Tax=Armatimonas sp. TaxID=1872638 RepID=UPI00286D1A1B|nr:PEP-CTERM sorting domain-containing protein [Armatimonas sp.]